MIKIPFEEMVSRISEKTGVPKEDISERIKKKLDQLSGLVSKEGAAHIVANELGIKLFDFSGELQVKSILSGMRDVEVTGKIMQVYDAKDFSTEKGKGKVASLILADQTGSIRLVLWNEQAEKVSSLKEGVVIKVKGGYIRERNEQKEIHLNDKGKLIECPGVIINVAEKRAESKRKRINELSENDLNAEIFANIVQIFEPKFFEVCPRCGKRAKFDNNAFSCGVHGSVEPAYSYVLNMFVDDGTGVIRAVCFRELVQKLLGMDSKNMLALKENPNDFVNSKTELTGALVKLNGRVTKNAMFDRIEFMINALDKNPDLDEEIARLNEEMKAKKECEVVDISDEEHIF